MKVTYGKYSFTGKFEQETQDVGQWLMSNIGNGDICKQVLQLQYMACVLMEGHLEAHPEHAERVAEILSEDEFRNPVIHA